MDAAERSILRRGFPASTMEIIAGEAGYSRSAMYQHFPSRRFLLEALVRRKTHKHQLEIASRLPENAGLADILVESLVIVATELIHDPLLQTLSDQTDEGTVAHVIANDPQLPELIEQLVGAMQDGEQGGQVRAGLRPGDVGKFIVTTALSMLLRVIPQIDDPDTARRYVQTFVLPALLADPPPPLYVFDM
jgi:AcrR family transcriptional regulator